MKELSIEKAKRYDEAIKRAKYWEKNPTVWSSDDICQKLFPELKESEDERIMEKVIATIHLYYGEPLEDEAKEMIAWLEKQGEQKYTQRDISDAYLKGVADVKREVEKIDEQTEKMKKDIAEFIFNSKEDIKQRYEWIKCLGFDVKFSNEEKQGEQKPVKFKPLFRVGDVIKPKDPVLGEPRIIKGIHPKFGYDTNNGILDFEFEDNWEFVEQNIAWSEEDEKMIRGLIAICDEWTTSHSFYPIENCDIEKLKNWLKSLKDRVQPQSHWKPSDEQIVAIDTAINVLGKGTLNGKQLIELKEQLKKLKG